MSKKDWRGFELLVSRLIATKNPDVIIKSPDLIQSTITGDYREVDASIRSIDGEYLTTLECRKRSKKEDVTWIEQLATKKNAIGANHTIAVSSSGFSKQAEVAAKAYGIETAIASRMTIREIEKLILLRFVLFNRYQVSLHSIRLTLKGNTPSLKGYTEEFLGDKNANDIVFISQDRIWTPNDMWKDIHSVVNPYEWITFGMEPQIRTAIFPFIFPVIAKLGDRETSISSVEISFLLWIDSTMVTTNESQSIDYQSSGEIRSQRVEFLSPEGFPSQSISFQKNISTGDEEYPKILYNQKPN